jgi:hypothetical protein
MAAETGFYAPDGLVGGIKTVLVRVEPDEEGAFFRWCKRWRIFAEFGSG